jgi:hypothetical protein
MQLLWLRNSRHSLATFCRIARKHFSSVTAKRSDGLILTLAGIRDMNVLFSNFAFAMAVRGMCQTMEAAVADPGLVFKLQVLGCCAATLRLLITHRLLSNSGAPGKQASVDKDDMPSTTVLLAPTSYGSTSVPGLPRTQPNVKLSPRNERQDAQKVDDISRTTIKSDLIAMLLPHNTLSTTVVHSTPPA